MTNSTYRLFVAKVLCKEAWHRRAFLFLVGLSCFFSQSLLAQDYYLISQYMYNGLVLNPAYAGSQQQFSFSGLYRNQWLNVEGSPVYQMVSAHTPAASNTIGVGLTASAEQIGVHRGYSAYLQLAYKFKLKVGYLSLGISGGTSVRNSNYNNLTLSDSNDPYLSAVDVNVQPNFGLGAYYYNGWMYAGFSVPYVLDPLRIDRDTARARSILREARSYFLTSGFLFGSSDVIRYNPSFLVRFREGSPLTADINFNLIIQKRVLAGASYRIGEGFVLLSQLILNDNFRVMYAYDLTTSRIGSSANGSHEISLNYRIIIRALSRDPDCSAYF